MSIGKPNRSIRRLLAAVLALAMLCTMGGAAVWADPETDAADSAATTGEAPVKTEETPVPVDAVVTTGETPATETAPAQTAPAATDGAAVETPSYDDYLAAHTDAKAATQDVVIKAAQAGVYDISRMEGAKVITDAAKLEGRESALLLTDDGTVTFTFTVPETALYSLRMEYHGYDETVSKGSVIERRMLVDGAPAYEESEYLSLGRVFRDVYRTAEDGSRLKDVNGNDIRPGQEEVFQWIVRDVYDTQGFCKEPLQLYLTAGTHTITLEPQREAFMLYAITLFAPKATPAYADVQKEYNNKGYQKAAGDIVYVQAEDLALKSEKSNYPLTDRSSAATMPQDAYANLLNFIGGEKWQNNASWVEWNVTVPKTGLYKMALRYKQDIYSGVKVSRRLTVNGELPFAEAAALTFNYAPSWTVTTLGDEDNGDYYFYFEEGKTYALRMECVLGEMGDLLGRVYAAMTSLNVDYRTILMITGSSPDKYRSYQFETLIPDTLEDMKKQAEELEKIVSEMIALTGETGERTATLTKLAAVLRQMTDKPIVIAAKFSMFKDDLSSLGTWVLESAYQPMKLDYTALVPDNQATPAADANFFQNLGFSFQYFLSSFVTDYQAVGTTNTGDEDSTKITVWVTSGRDQSNIIRNMIDTSFTPNTNIGVNLQLVTGGALLPSVLAGRGPDVTVGVGAGDPINYAVRKAVISLSDKEGFDEVCERFYPSALVPYTFMGKTYALPETQSFSMMFVRTDIFDDMGLKVPETWDELELLIPELLNYNMSIGLGHGLNDLLMFMYQQGAPLYLNEGESSNLDSAVAVRCFTKLCEYYTLYGFPTDFDAANRFRSGEIPLLLADYGLYNQLSLFAPEIRGDWAMYQIPGTKQADGTINRAETSGGAAVAMFRGCRDEDAAWEFMKWWTDADTQLRYGNEMEIAMNGSARQAVANVEALSRMSWSAKDLGNILEQWRNVEGTPEVPGSYYTARIQGFAFSNAYNNSVDPGDALQQYIESLNAELKRKRAEFGL